MAQGSGLRAQGRRTLEGDPLRGGARGGLMQMAQGSRLRAQGSGHRAEGSGQKDT